jgi:hypothetical protein
MSEYLIDVRNLKQYFPIRSGWFGVKLLKAMSRYSNIGKGNFEWMPGCYPEQIGLITVDRKATEAEATAVPLDDGVEIS